jgi:hypothetical protein
MDPRHPFGGLFVGINRFELLGVEWDLKGAYIDAFSYHDYFSKALPTGAWSTLVHDEQRGIPRGELLRGIRRFSKAIPNGHFGIIVLCSHGFVEDGELLIACSDYDTELGAESGVSIKWITRTLEDENKRNVGFLLILDCCCKGKINLARHNAPSNVVVAFASFNGKTSLEDAAGGLFSRLFINTLSNAQPRRVATFDCVRLSTLIGLIQDRLDQYPLVRARNPYFHGQLNNEMLIPHVRLARSSIEHNPLDSFLFQSREASGKGLGTVKALMSSALNQDTLHGEVLTTTRAFQVAFRHFKNTGEERSALYGFISKFGRWLTQLVVREVKLPATNQFLLRTRQVFGGKVTNIGDARRRIRVLEFICQGARVVVTEQRSEYVICAQDDDGNPKTMESIANCIMTCLDLIFIRQADWG